MTQLDHEAPRRSTATAAAACFVVLILLMLTLILVGGYVRLSGSGLSIPDWPHVNGSYLPPATDAEWATVKAAYDLDQDRLLELGRLKRAGLGSRGHIPADMTEFRRMFLVEWSHRAVAAILGLVSFLCLLLVLCCRVLRRRAWRAATAIVLLIGFEILLGGILVKSGTSTQWLFFHLAMATVILCTMLVALIQVLGVSRQGEDSHRAVRRQVRHALLLVLTQIILGALVAGSRHNAPGIVVTWPLMQGQFAPDGLWRGDLSLFHNLLDNTLLLQWIHRWFALVVVLQLGQLFWTARRDGVPPQAKKALIALASLLVLQVVLGLTNVLHAAPTAVALAHLETALCMMAVLTVCALVLRGKAQPVAKS